MPSHTLSFRAARRVWKLSATIEASGDDAAAWFEAHVADPGTRALLRGFPDYAVSVSVGPSGAERALRGTVGRSVVFDTVRRRLDQVATGSGATARPLELSPGLWLQEGGRFASAATAEPDAAALVTAARWVSRRRTVSFERLFPRDAFHPELPERFERVEPEEAEVMRTWLGERLSTAAPQERSAIATILSHLVATAARDEAYAPVGTAAADMLLALGGSEPVDALRAHVIGLLQLRGSALTREQADRARQLLQGLTRTAPPYAELGQEWCFAMVSAWDFHNGEVETLIRTHGFTELAASHARPGFSHAVEAPFRGPNGQRIRIWARGGSPSDETREMGDPTFHGLLINRHAQLGSFDLKAAAVASPQRGYKLLVNSQCAGLTTRFAIARCYPDADLYTSWDSTYFRTDPRSQEIVASEGLDCFVAILRAMSEGLDHAGISRRIRKAQWHHAAALSADFVQFIGPAHPAVIARYEDVNLDGKADFYDGFCDLELIRIAEDVAASATPRAPGVAASAITGEAATGLGWAVGSMNRVAQYSDLWEGLLGRSELYYPFTAAGFSDFGAMDLAPPPTGEASESLPAACRVQEDGDMLRAEVSLHAWFAHSGKEYKRLLVAAECFWRCLDAGVLHLPKGLDSVAHARAALLLTLAGLLEYPADQNALDAMWSAALLRLRLPELSRSLVRQCITSEDHDASNYYGSRRGLPELLDVIGSADRVAAAKLADPDPRVGRPAPIVPPSATVR